MHFAVLGQVEVSVDGVALPLRGPKQRAMLAVLLCNANRPVTSDMLTEALWGESPPRSAVDNLRLYASQLRRMLGSDRLVHRHGAYVLTVEPEELDAHVFQELAEQGAEALRRGERRLAADLLDRALRLWRGPAYAELETTDEAQRLEELRLVALENRIDADIALGRNAELIPELVGHIAAHPLRERPRGQLMFTLAQSGRRAEALTLYAGTRSLFADELGVEPGAELQELHLTILRGEDRAPAQLPLNIADFTGRDAQVAELTGYVSADGQAPVMVISGMGGVGKSALAVHVAHRLLGSFPDGQLYADLHNASPASVLSGFLAALGVAGWSVPEDLSARAALFRSHLSRRKVLILLDNATSEQQVRWLLPGSPSCVVLVTSRARLSGLEGACLVELDVLPSADAMALFTRVVGRKRVEEESSALAEIAELCGHMPLAVRIAGARLVARPLRTLDWLVRRLRDEHSRLDQLVAGDQAVRASISLSYVGLSERARRLFRLLGLLDAPDFAAWVASALLACSFEEGEALLDELVEAQLLSAFGVDAMGNPRYRFHDLVRLFAREGVSDDPEAVARALGAWLGLAERAMEDVPGPCYAIIHGSAARWDLPQHVVEEYLGDAMAWFEDERPALLAAVRQACARSLDEYAWDLAGSMERYFDVRGFYDDCWSVNGMALELCRKNGNRLGEAVMLRGLLDITTWTGARHEGPAMVALNTNAEQLADMFREIDEPRGLSDAHAMRAWGLVATGLAGEGLAEARTALRLAEESRHLGGEARAHLALAVAYGKSEVDKAIKHLLNALRLAEEMGNQRFEATALQFLGLAYTEARRFEDGHACLSRSMEICHRSPDPSSETWTLVSLAKLYARQGDIRARRVAEAAESMSREYTLTHHLADSLFILGALDLAAGAVDSAIGRLEESVAFWRTRGWSEFHAQTLLVLAEAYAARGDEAAAETCREKARALTDRP
ncbi:AfsR/SARP family transcriptional regulator [Rhizohabitans arisaemae]|uniref:AfsR/SARP family transcriptional regulator n=1 Tax=Rhizohabitans arisaemae TaxID=2720610 RepID=UPI0024B0A47A|nr:BTAD domain-containing putative transcriptional regulator [Rhizohabitans arisaemae]